MVKVTIWGEVDVPVLLFVSDNIRYRSVCVR